MYLFMEVNSLYCRRCIPIFVDVKKYIDISLWKRQRSKAGLSNYDVITITTLV